MTVIGVQPEAQDEDDAKSIDQPSMGLGLNSLLAESLYDTGRFRLVEHRDAAEREYLADLVLTHWKGRGADYPISDLSAAWKKLASDYLAYGSIQYARASKQGLRIGPFSRHKQILAVKARACLYTASWDQPICQSGEGEAEEVGTGVVYVYDGDAIAFKKNAAGLATQRAILAAAQKVAAVLGPIPTGGD